MTTMQVSEKIIINQPRTQVFEYVRKLKNQNEYSAWSARDPERQLDYVGTDGKEGFVYSWNSTVRRIGSGSQQITRIIDNERIDTQLTFLAPVKNVGSASIALREIDDHCEITWSFSSRLKFPFNLFKRTFERSLIKDIQQSLANLKHILEQPR